MSFTEWIGYIPAIIFPCATIIQIAHLLKSKSSEGVSALAWGAFSVGNICLYLYTEKTQEIQAILGLLVTSMLQIYIIFLVYRFKKRK